MGCLVPKNQFPIIYNLNSVVLVFLLLLVGAILWKIFLKQWKILMPQECTCNIFVTIRLGMLRLFLFRRTLGWVVPKNQFPINYKLEVENQISIKSKMA